MLLNNSQTIELDKNWLKCEEISHNDKENIDKVAYHV